VGWIFFWSVAGVIQEAERSRVAWQSSRQVQEVSAAPGLLCLGASGFKPHSFGVCMVGFPY